MGNIFAQLVSQHGLLHCKLNELLLALLPFAQLVSQQISVLQVEKKNVAKSRTRFSF